MCLCIYYIINLQLKILIAYLFYLLVTDFMLVDGLSVFLVSRSLASRDKMKWLCSNLNYFIKADFNPNLCKHESSLCSSQKQKFKKFVKE